MIKNLLKLADKLEADGTNKDLAKRIDNFLISIAQGIEGSISAKDLVQLQPGGARKHHMLRALLELIDFDLIVERDEEGQGNRVKAIPKIPEGKTDALNLGEMLSTPGLQRFLNVEKEEDVPLIPRNQFYVDSPANRRKYPEMVQSQEEGGAPEDVPLIPRNQFYVDSPANRRKYPEMVQSSVIEKLVKMADKFDQEGNFKMAEKIDTVLRKITADTTEQNQSTNVVEASRPKAPLKNLKDDVKKNLVLFIIDADKSMSKGVGGLKELFRRLRYFDIDDTVKELGLDKVVKEMEKTQNCLDSAKKDFYTITFGKRPSEKDLEELIKELTDNDDNSDDGQTALDFFDSHSENDVEHECPEEDNEPEIEVVSIDDENIDDDDIEEILRDFWDDDQEESE